MVLAVLVLVALDRRWSWLRTTRAGPVLVVLVALVLVALELGRSWPTTARAPGVLAVLVVLVLADHGPALVVLVLAALELGRSWLRSCARAGPFGNYLLRRPGKIISTAPAWGPLAENSKARGGYRGRASSV